MMKYVNFHTHTKRCMHAGGTEEEYVRKAIQQGVKHLGFSDHAPFPDFDYGYRMKMQELSEYITELKRLRKKYKDILEISIGLEIEYLPWHEGYYRSLLEEWGIDYLLLGQHFYQNRQGYLSDAGTDYMEYAWSLERALNTGFFCVLAHPDVFINFSSPFALRASKLIVEAAIHNGVVLEYNAARFRKDEQWSDLQNPFWSIVRQANAKVIVGSDAHSPDCIWDEWMARAYESLDELGIQPVFSIF